MDRLLLPGLAPGATILDLCCGTGQLSKHFADRGYKIIGLDSSAEMLRYAREDVPQADFMLADATDFKLESQVDAAVCTFDSLNHILQPEALLAALRNVHAALKPGCRFVFDINTPAAYGAQWDESAFEIQPDHVFFLRGGYDPALGIGTTKITMFRLYQCWERADVEVRQRPWEVAEMEQMLGSAGFADIHHVSVQRDLGIAGHHGEGRVHMVCRSL